MMLNPDMQTFCIKQLGSDRGDTGSSGSDAEQTVFPGSGGPAVEEPEEDTIDLRKTSYVKATQVRG